LDDTKGLTVQQIIDGYSGCYEDKKSYNGNVGISQSFDVTGSKAIKTLKEKAEDFGIDVSLSATISGKLGGSKSNIINDGTECDEDNPTLCLKKDVIAISGSLGVGGSGSGGAMVKGYAGGSISLSYSTTYTFTGSKDAVSGDLCFEVSVKSEVKFTITAQITINLWFRKWTFKGTVLAITFFISFTANSCNFNITPEWDIDLDWFPTVGNRAMTTSCDDPGDTWDENTKILTNIDVQGCDLNGSSIDWNEDAVSCADIGWTCGTFHTSAEEIQDCGTCGVGLSCEPKKIDDGTQCSCKQGHMICDGPNILQCEADCDSSGYTLELISCENICGYGNFGLPYCFEDTATTKHYLCIDDDECAEQEVGFCRYYQGPYGVCVDPLTGEPFEK